MLWAQDLATVSGQVLDNQTRIGLPMANVILSNRFDSTIVSGTVSEVDGHFTLTGVPNGNFILFFSFVGYEDQALPMLIGDLNHIFDVGKIALTPDNRQLGEVVVVTSREVVSSGLEKKIFSVEENISQQGSSVLDALRNLPGVTISSDGKILLRGSDQVAILIDGKQSSLTGFSNQKGLDNLPATNIDKIEIINNPSARYNASGMAGLINVIYKKETNTGFNGEASLNVGVGEFWQRQENLPRITPKYAQTPKANPSINMNYRTTKANWFFQGDGIVRRRVNANEFTTRDYTDGTTDIQSQFLENRTQKLYNLKGGIDMYLSKANTLTLFALWQDEYHIDLGDVPYDNLETGQRLRLWTWREDEHTRFINYAVNYHHKFLQSGHEIKIGYQYTGGGEDEFFPFTDSSAVRTGDDATFLTVFEYVHAFNIDYVKPLRAGRLEMGSRITLRNIPITYTLTPGQNSILDPNLGLWSKYHENVYATYLNYVRESNHLDIEAGMRFEPSWVSYELDPTNAYYQDNAYQYLPFFPNIRLTYKINDDHTLSLFHNRRVDRPGEFDVRPFPKYDDPEILKTGNPNLRPQFTNTFELAYKHYWTSGSFFASAYARFIENIFSRIYTQDSTSIYNIIHTIPANLGNGRNLGMELVYQQEISSKMKLNASMTVYQNRIDAFNGTSSYPYPQPFASDLSEVTTGNAKLILTWKFPKQIEFQLSNVYYAPDIIPQGKVRERYSLDFGLKKTSANGHFEWRLSTTDLLNTFQIRKEITGTNFNLTANNYYETQVVTWGMKYKF